MATKNKRTSVKKVTTENRLKSKLKEDYDNFLHEEDDELPTEGEPTEGGDDDLDFDATGEGGGDLGGEVGGEETGLDGGQGEEGIDLGDDDVDLTPTQDEWMDKEVDELLGGELGGEQSLGADDELALDEEDMMNSGSESMMSEDELDGDLNMEEPSDELGDIDGETHNHGVHVDHGDDVFSADELNSMIDEPDTLYDLEDNLAQKAGNMTDDEILPDLEGVEEYTGGDEGLGDESLDGDHLGLDDEDHYLGEDAGDHKEPITGLKGEDHGSFEQGYEGGKSKTNGFQVKDELMEADIMKALGWSEEKPKLEKKFSGVTKDAKTGNTPAKKNLGDDFDKVSDTVKESIKKSKMLVKAAGAILKLKEANDKLKVENYKLTKVNGILAAIGDRLNKDTRKKIGESFSKCTSEKEVNSLYEKVVKVVRESNRPSLNETVLRKKTNIPSKTNESTEVEQPKVKRVLTEDVKRKMYLMGIPGYDEQYFQ